MSATAAIKPITKSHPVALIGTQQCDREKRDKRASFKPTLVHACANQVLEQILRSQLKRQRARRFNSRKDFVGWIAERVIDKRRIRRQDVRLKLAFEVLDTLQSGPHAQRKLRMQRDSGERWGGVVVRVTEVGIQHLLDEHARQETMERHPAGKAGYRTGVFA